MNIQVGQIWEDADSRRKGRTFKIANIDNTGMVTCENLTGPKGTEPKKPLSFINKNRFTKKYYKLTNVASPDTLWEHEAVTIVNNILPLPTVIRRAPKPILSEECEKYWTGNWRQAGDFAILTDDAERFEVTVRALGRNDDSYNIRIKLGHYCLGDMNVQAKLYKAVMHAKDFLHTLSSQLNNFLMKGTEI